ncbi:MAG: hypothetical protein QOE34_1284 [Verrucomicrobiota bacterium]|jgi:hypothetical protein
MISPAICRINRAQCKRRVTNRRDGIAWQERVAAASVAASLCEAPEMRVPKLPRLQGLRLSALARTIPSDMSHRDATLL